MLSSLAVTERRGAFLRAALDQLDREGVTSRGAQQETACGDRLGSIFWVRPDPFEESVCLGVIGQYQVRTPGASGSSSPPMLRLVMSAPRP